MTSFENASILMLDDEPDNLIHTTKVFEKEGLRIQTTGSLQQASSEIENKTPDIFICDLKLDQIDDAENGNIILGKIRRSDKNIFLALYSAYLRDLDVHELKALEENNIKFYDKSSTDIFMLNLQRDYNRFVAQKQGYIDTQASTLLDTIKQDTISHLKNLSNPNLLIPVEGFPDFAAKELIKQVSLETPVGKKYMHEWYQTLSLIGQLRKTPL